MENTQLEATVKNIVSIIAKHRLVADRVAELTRHGHEVARLPMGSGGVGQVKEMADHYRVQIGYGVTRHNYAMAVVLKKWLNLPTKHLTI